MPACQGLPTRSCPLNKCDASVELCQGDLMLCHNCAHSRFPQLRDPNTTDIKQRIEVKANQPQVHVVGNNNNNDATGQINTGMACIEVYDVLWYVAMYRGTKRYVEVCCVILWYMPSVGVYALGLEYTIWLAYMFSS